MKCSIPECRAVERSSTATMALQKVKGNLERMFDKNLTDLVRGIRNNKVRSNYM